MNLIERIFIFVMHFTIQFIWLLSYRFITWFEVTKVGLFPRKYKKRKGYLKWLPCKIRKKNLKMKFSHHLWVSYTKSIRLDLWVSLVYHNKRILNKLYVQEKFRVHIFWNYKHVILYVMENLQTILNILST